MHEHRLNGHSPHSIAVRSPTRIPQKARSKIPLSATGIAMIAPTIADSVRGELGAGKASRVQPRSNRIAFCDLLLQGQVINGNSIAPRAA